MYGVFFFLVMSKIVPFFYKWSGTTLQFSISKNRMEDWKMKDIKYIIADNVKLYRKRKNLTQLDLAERSELSLDSIKRVERGQRTMSLDNFLRISDALHIPLSFLLYDQVEDIPDAERILCVLKGKSKKQKDYLLHMLHEMAIGMDKLV